MKRGLREIAREPARGVGAHARHDRFVILKAADLKDSSEWVFPSFWLGAIFGGAGFLRGWRVDDPPVARARRSRRPMEDAIFLRNVFGWGGTVCAVAALMIIWYLLSGWKERKNLAAVWQF